MGVQGGGVEVGAADRRRLEGWLRSHSTPQALATRARIVLGSADGESIRELAERLEVASGKVHARCFRRHRHMEFIAFLNSLVRRYPGRELHLICDNYGTHKHPEVARWLEAHPRIRLHFTPTGASWLNLVERWFGLITERAIRRGSFDSVRRLELAINRWLARWNENARPFRWTKSAADIKRSIRAAELIYETEP